MSSEKREPTARPRARKNVIIDPAISLFSTETRLWHITHGLHIRIIQYVILLLSTDTHQPNTWQVFSQFNSITQNVSFSLSIALFTNFPERGSHSLVSAFTGAASLSFQHGEWGNYLYCAQTFTNPTDMFTHCVSIRPCISEPLETYVLMFVCHEWNVWSHSTHVPRCIHHVQSSKVAVREAKQTAGDHGDVVIVDENRKIGVARLDVT